MKDESREAGLPGATAKDIERLEEKIDRIVVLLSGNGDPSKGLIVRVDRLEQFKTSVDAWLARFVIPVLIAQTLSILTFVGGVLTHTIKIGF